MKYLNQAKRFGARVATAAVVAVTASPVFAAVDTTAVTDAVADAKTAVGVIGGAVLGVIVIVAMYKWLRRPIS